jgi:hypothetical protein
VVNNLVTGNGQAGTTGTPLGGFNINAATTLEFANNTVADNYAQSGAAAGVICSAPSQKVVNSIIWGNNLGVANQLAQCTATYSDIQNSTGGTGNIKLDPNFKTTYEPQETACFNSGNNSAAGVGALDITGGARVKGAKIDMGAFEVQ